MIHTHAARVTLPHPPLTDDDLPGVGLLLSPRPEPVLAAFAAMDAPLEAVRPRQVTWWPGRSITVRYDVTGPEGVPEQVVACAGIVPEGAVVVSEGAERIGLWALPNDPALPGLASALEPEMVSAMLQDLGLAVTHVDLRLRAYRPTQRAVVEVTVPGARLFLKLGRREAIERLHAVHTQLGDSLPVPTSLGYDPRLGILVMAERRGGTLRQSLDRTGPIPDVDRIGAVPAALPPPEDGRATPSPLERLPALADLLTRLAPDRAAVIDRLVDELGPDDEDATVPVHGDFHDGQLLVDGAAITGLVDVDTFGLGRANDDPAVMLAHLENRRDRGPRTIGRLADELTRHWSADHDPHDLWRRVVAVLLGLATGPFRVQHEDWPTLVRHRIDRAAAIADESPLTIVTGHSHAVHPE